MVAFFDEVDPTFCVCEWIDAGWRDPTLVSAVLRICGARSAAEVCVAGLKADIGKAYSVRTVGRLARYFSRTYASRIDLS